MDMNIRLKNLFAKVLKVNIEDITDETMMNNPASWDSLATMLLIAEIEDEFHIEFTINDIAKVISVRAVKEILKSKGINNNE